MALLLGIDLGTSYFKVGLFDERGALRGLGRVSVTIETSGLKRELPVQTFWQFLRQALADALSQAGANVAEIRGLSYSSQANTFVLLDRHDAPLTPFILWTDSRVQAVDEDLWGFVHRAGYARRVGHGDITGSAAVAKWCWIRQYCPELWARTHRIMTMSDYFTYALTGEIVGDAATAAFLGIYDLSAREWWSSALKVVNVEKSQLSRTLAPGTPCGHTCAVASDLLGLPAGIPFAVGSLDHHVAALGSGLGRIADVSISTGTVLAAITLTPTISPQPSCYHGPHFNGGGFFRLAFASMGAGQLEEYQRRYAPDLDLEKLLALAALAMPGQQPRHRPHTHSSSAEHGIAIRYMLEKIAITQLALIRQVRDEPVVHKIVATGGGARSALWLQIQADTFGAPILMPGSPERACLGAAMLASVAAKTHGDLASAMSVMLQVGQDHIPDLKMTRFYRNLISRIAADSSGE